MYQHRIARVAMYTLLMLAGVLYAVYPSPTLEHQIDWKIYIWSGFLSVGGTTCLTASIRGRWLGEYFGLPLLYTAFVVFGLASLIAAGGSGSRLVLGLVLLAFAGGLFSRWQDVGSYRKGKPKQ